MDDVLFSSESIEWSTPPALFQRLDRHYCFDYDPAATHENHLTRRYSTLEGTFVEREPDFEPIKTSDLDGLDENWDGWHIFLNPPYGRGIGAWVQKAAESDCLVVALLPVRTGTHWWQDWVMPYADIEFLRGRLKFGGATNSAPFDSAIVRYR